MLLKHVQLLQGRNVSQYCRSNNSPYYFNAFPAYQYFLSHEDNHSMITEIVDSF